MSDADPLNHLDRANIMRGDLAFPLIRNALKRYEATVQSVERERDAALADRAKLIETVRLLAGPGARPPFSLATTPEGYRAVVAGSVIVARRPCFTPEASDLSAALNDVAGIGWPESHLDKKAKP